MILYHGSPNREFVPEYGKGEDKHDYGRGFYLTEDIILAREWAVCNPGGGNGWVHKYCLDCEDLKIFDFESAGILPWLAELMKHRAADSSRRYRLLSEKFISRYGVSLDGYDVIRGWRADASYFYIAKAFVRDEIDLCILEELFHMGDLGIQYCLKSPKAFHVLEAEDAASLEMVDYNVFNEKYNVRDRNARIAMKELIDSEKNKVTDVFSTLL